MKQSLDHLRNNYVKSLDLISEYLMKFIAIVAIVLAPIQPILIAVGVLVFSDLFLGVWASFKEKLPITSAGLKKTFSKVFAYQMAIIVAFILETYLVDGIPFVKGAAGLIGLVEGKSVFENLYRITGIDFWSEAMKKINSAVKLLPEDINKKK